MMPKINIRCSSCHVGSYAEQENKNRRALGLIPLATRQDDAVDPTEHQLRKPKKVSASHGMSLKRNRPPVLPTSHKSWIATKQPENNLSWQVLRKLALSTCPGYLTNSNPEPSESGTRYKMPTIIVHKVSSKLYENLTFWSVSGCKSSKNAPIISNVIRGMNRLRYKVGQHIYNSLDAPQTAHVDSK